MLSTANMPCSRWTERCLFLLLTFYSRLKNNNTAADRDTGNGLIRQNNGSSHGEAASVSDRTSLGVEGRGLLESVVCRRWRGSAPASAILVLWNALPPGDPQSTELAGNSTEQRRAVCPSALSTALGEFLLVLPQGCNFRDLHSQKSNLIRDVFLCLCFCITKDSRKQHHCKTPRMAQGSSVLFHQCKCQAVPMVLRGSQSCRGTHCHSSQN